MPEQETPETVTEGDFGESLGRWLGIQHIFDEIYRERESQVEQWGDQPLPLGFGGHQYRVLSDQYRRERDEASASGELTHRHILLDKFFDAVSEYRPQQARDELIQLAAVAVKVIQDIDRAAAGGV